MKRIGCYIVGFLALFPWPASTLQAQNLVPNPGFETFRQCPRYLGNAADDLDEWQTPTQGSTDFFHACSQTMGAPENFNGKQGVLEGEGYAGFYAYAPQDYREYLQVPLRQPLEKDRAYSLSFYVSLSERSDFAVGNLGVLFAREPLQVRTKKYLSKKIWYAQKGNQYHYLENQGSDYLENMEGWQEVQFEFVAKGTERYLLLGNFQANAQTRTRPTGRSSNKGAYYYIDRVALLAEGTAAGPAPYAVDSLQVLPALLFEFDTDRLTPTGETELGKLYEFLGAHPTYFLELHGHTDGLGSADYNQALSRRRCQAVADYLRSLGLPPGRVGWQAHGATRPVGDNGTPEGRRQNRRVEFRIRSREPKVGRAERK